MRIAVAADHAGFELKNAIKRHLESLGHEVRDFGTDGPDSVDYPDYGGPAAATVPSGESDAAILVCGSGQGMCMTANKVSGVRAALAWTAEIAELSRLHNDANVLCLPGRFVAEKEGIEIVDRWLASKFEGGRHVARVSKMMGTE